MDCTYKTNKYKMPRCHHLLRGILLHEGRDLQRLRVGDESSSAPIQSSGPYPVTVIFDGDRALSSALSHVFAEEGHRVHHILCIWHINQNVTANCKKYFPTNEEWEAFYRRWKEIVYSNTIALLEERYNSLHRDYSDAHWMIFDYLEEHLWPRRRKWAKCYTDKFLHFANTA